jgi:flagellar motor switch protein FliM
MPASRDSKVLRRKIAAHIRQPPPRPDACAAAGRAFGRALRHAALPFEGLGLSLGEVTVISGQPLEAAVAAMPDHGLLAGVEAEQDGQRGLLALSSGLVDALVEVQTTGRVEAGQPAARPVTRIDEALSRDFIDFVLSAFARETAALDGRAWPARMVYGSRVGDRGQIALLFPERDYMIATADLEFAGVDRRARFVLVLPVDPAGVMPVGAAHGARMPDAAWVAARARMLDALRLPLETVLLRAVRPLAQVQALAVGDLLAFSPADLLEVSLETVDGRPLAHGRLGQIGGRRAVRLQGSDQGQRSASCGAAPAAATQPESGPEAAPKMPPVPDQPPAPTPLALRSVRG